MLQTLENNNFSIPIELSDTAETTRKLSCQTDLIRMYLEVVERTRAMKFLRSYTDGQRAQHFR